MVDNHGLLRDGRGVVGPRRTAGVGRAARDADHRQDPIAAATPGHIPRPPTPPSRPPSGWSSASLVETTFSFKPGPHQTAPSRDPSSLRPALESSPAPEHCRPGFRRTVRPLLQPAIWFEIRCSGAPTGRWAWLRRRAETNLGQCFIVETVRQRGGIEQNYFLIRLLPRQTQGFYL